MIYLAGPLFNDGERHEMALLAAALEQRGLATFLPQRDGLELASLTKSTPEAGALWSKAIFQLDIAHLLACRGVVVNLDGRVPDEGAMVEAGIAWASGKPLVFYQRDARRCFAGDNNPMISGLAPHPPLSEPTEVADLMIALLETWDERQHMTARLALSGQCSQWQQLRHLPIPQQLHAIGRLLAE